MTETTRDPHKTPHVGDVFVAPYPHDCDEKLRETIRVVETYERMHADKSVLVGVRYVRGALRTPRDRGIEEFRRQVDGWAVRQLEA